MAFPEKLKALRIEKEWSQNDLAQRAGLTKLMISKYETGRSAPNLENLGKIARALGVTSDYLIFEDVPRNGRLEVRDVELYERLQQAQEMDEHDRAVLKDVIEALIARRRAERFAQDLGSGKGK